MLVTLLKVIPQIFSSRSFLDTTTLFRGFFGFIKEGHKETNIVNEVWPGWRREMRVESSTGIFEHLKGKLAMSWMRGLNRKTPSTEPCGTSPTCSLAQNWLCSLSLSFSDPSSSPRWCLLEWYWSTLNFSSIPMISSWDPQLNALDSYDYWRMAIFFDVWFL